MSDRSFNDAQPSPAATVDRAEWAINGAHDFAEQLHSSAGIGDVPEYEDDATDWAPKAVANAGIYGAEKLPPGVSIASANKAIEFLEWLSGYIGHGPAIQISSDQMEYIRSKVHPLVHELDGRSPAQPQAVPRCADCPSRYLNGGCSGHQCDQDGQTCPMCGRVGNGEG